MDSNTQDELDISSALDILDVLMVPLVIFRVKDNWVVYANDEASELTGFTRQELLGKKFNSLIVDEEMSKFTNLIQLAKNSDTQEDQFEIVRKSQRHFKAKVKVRLVEDNELVLVLIFAD